MSDVTAKLAISAAHHAVMLKARALFPTYVKASPVVRFDLKGRTCGGKASGSRNYIKYNLDWYNANPAKYIAEVIPHEIAHIVADATGLGKGHDRGWRSIDLMLGGNGQATGGVDAPIRKARVTNQYLYIDSKGIEIWVGAVHHKRLQTKHATTGYTLRVAARGTRITADGFRGQKRLAA